MSLPKTHYSGYENTNDNFTKSLLMDFFTDFWGTFCCQFWESSTSWPARRSNLDGAIFHTHVNRTGTIWRKKSESISVWKRDIVGFVHNAEDKCTLQLNPMTKFIFDFCPENFIPLEFNSSNLTVNADVNGRSLMVLLECPKTSESYSSNSNGDSLNIWQKVVFSKLRKIGRWQLKLCRYGPQHLEDAIV